MLTGSRSLASLSAEDMVATVEMKGKVRRAGGVVKANYIGRGLVPHAGRTRRRSKHAVMGADVRNPVCNVSRTAQAAQPPRPTPRHIASPRLCQRE